MKIGTLTAACTLLLGLAAPAPAQFREDNGPGEAKTGPAKLQKLRVGIIIRAAQGGYCRGISAHMAVPADWPEQQVRIVEEEVSPSARVSYRMIDGMARAMHLQATRLGSGQEAKAIVTFEIRRSSVLPPEDTDQYVLPDQRKLDASLRLLLAPSPLIESRDRKIRALAKQIGAEQEKAWDRVEAIYDWVRQKVQYKNGPIKGALAALRDGTGDCEELTSLFIAICRAAGIPARTVWVEGHCYPEFYLHDKQGKGHWFPCQAAGTRAFGGIPELRPVLQKGDSIRPPHNRRDRQRYLANHVEIADRAGTPSCRFIREAVSD